MLKDKRQMIEEIGMKFDEAIELFSDETLESMVMVNIVGGEGSNTYCGGAQCVSGCNNNCGGCGNSGTTGGKSGITGNTNTYSGIGSGILSNNQVEVQVSCISISK